MRRLIVASLMLAFLPVPAFSHDHWINAGRYRSPTDGMLCCGINDCAIIPIDRITATAIGYRLSNGEIIPYSEALTSEDGQYHRCHKPDGSRRCFFAPMPGS